MRGIEVFSILSLVALVACREQTKEENTLFRLLDASQTGITFANNLDYTEELNTYTFRNFYNGGGVGLGDFNNDGLLDIFFSGNLVSNKLYLNTGSFQFKDITETAGLGGNGLWTTGISIVDINADGLLDIYLCKSGPPGGTRRNNELFINNGDLTFSEQSKKFGLDFTGLSIHAAFFDFDKDGDLDCYLLNNSIRSVGGYDLRQNQRNIPDTLGGNKLLRNDKGKFIDVSQAAGIYTSEIGFGLGVTIGDVNQDGWPDIYVSNDFFEKDYLYINDKDGTFTESLENYIREISLGSMGADMADINNDGLPEIFVTEMLPERDKRLKTTAQFENWEKYQLNVEKGYYKQFSRNTLQLNNGNGSYSEIGRLAGVHATDWSWGALIVDLDKDGWKDIFVANGIYKDLIDQDYVNFVANQAVVREILFKDKGGIKQLIDSIPSNKIPNYAFHNNGDLTFTNKAEAWGLGEPSHSNGSAYGDLDNDGDVDLVLSNVNMPAFIYENRSELIYPQRHHLTFVLHGEAPNVFAIGSKVKLKAGDQLFYQELSPMRGFMSSVDYRLHFGLGDIKMIDSVIIEWPDGKISTRAQVETNKLLDVYQRDATHNTSNVPAMSSSSVLLTELPVLPGVDFIHQESDFDDFDRDRLLFNMISNEGPCLCTGDINRDGREDFYIGGAKNQRGRLYIQNNSGVFKSVEEKLFDSDKASEDLGCIFFDANGDHLLDLYVTSGGNEFSSSSPALADRLYFNKSGNHFEKSLQILPSSVRFESTSVVEETDFDKDGDLDLFVGGRLTPFLYGIPSNGYVLRNEGKGHFTDVTSEVAPGLLKLGMITDAKWTDVNHDSLPDLIIVGEWMPIKLFMNEGGKLLDRTLAYGLEDTEGWYHCVITGDFNKDGWIDFIAGNHGLNSRFKASASRPVSLYINDFDQNGTVEQILTQYQDSVSYPLVLRQDLVTQLPYLKKKYLHYKNYHGQAITDIFTPDQIKSSLIVKAKTFETTLWLNTGKGDFENKKLPLEVQFSPVYAILVDDFDKDGNYDVILGGNLYRAKPETGIYDGSYGLFLKGDGSGNFTSIPGNKSGFFIKGEIRSIRKLTYKGTNLILVARNNNTPVILQYESEK